MLYILFMYLFSDAVHLIYVFIFAKLETESAMCVGYFFFCIFYFPVF
jgi:hypothetical protein